MTMALDRFSPDVQNFKKWLDDEIETSRNGLERIGKNEADTAVLRGYIKAMRKVLTHLDGDPDDNDPSS